MRTPLNDALRGDGRALVPAEADAGRQLAVLFEAAEARENEYAAARLRELYEVAERAMTLGREVATRAAQPPAVGSAWPERIASLVGGGLLAACAPLVAQTSALLAVASGVAAAAAILLPLRPGRRARPALPPPDPSRAAVKLEGVAAAADRALQAMVEPRRLPAPAAEAGPDEDVLGLLQDALMLAREGEGPMAEELGENAERLARRMGYAPVYEGDDALFEAMVDPSVTAPVTLRPALVHEQAGRTVYGVRVRGRA